MNGITLTNTYGNLLRRNALSILNPQSSILASTAFGYDAASRLATVSDGNGNTAGYSYLANSPLVGQIAFANDGAVRMTTTKQYDYLNRLTGIYSGTGVSPVSSFAYAYNSANQRTQVTKRGQPITMLIFGLTGRGVKGSVRQSTIFRSELPRSQDMAVSIPVNERHHPHQHLRQPIAQECFVHPQSSILHPRFNGLWLRRRLPPGDRQR
jgi:YD repeat-containing protein